MYSGARVRRFARVAFPRLIVCSSGQHRVPTRHLLVESQLEVCILAILCKEANKVEVSISIKLLEFKKVPDHILLSLQLISPVRVFSLRF